LKNAVHFRTSAAKPCFYCEQLHILQETLKGLENELRVRWQASKSESNT